MGLEPHPYFISLPLNPNPGGPWDISMKFQLSLRANLKAIKSKEVEGNRSYSKEVVFFLYLCIYVIPSINEFIQQRKKVLYVFYIIPSNGYITM